jgi:hypothetical protein
MMGIVRQGAPSGNSNIQKMPPEARTHVLVAVSGRAVYSVAYTGLVCSDSGRNQKRFSKVQYRLSCVPAGTGDGEEADAIGL